MKKLWELEQEPEKNYFKKVEKNKRKGKKRKDKYFGKNLIAKENEKIHN